MVTNALVEDTTTDLLGALEGSPTPFHAADQLSAHLAKQGFIHLNEDELWDLQPGKGYFYTRSNSSFVAFICGTEDAEQHGVRVVGAHTDSPCLKLKPKPQKINKGYLQLGIEVYGGALLNPWFDRDLSLAGRVSFIDSVGDLQHTLVDFERPIAVVPSLAIHLDRSANKDRTVNPQRHMNAVLAQVEDSSPHFEQSLMDLLKDKGIDDVAEIFDFNLSFYDTQAPSVVGLNRQFFASARLDNLLSCFIGAFALGDAARRHTSILVCNDHEEVGSRSDIGAQGTMMSDLLERLFPDSEARQCALRKSMMLSVDNAHGVHPNYADKHDDSHGPLLNRGPVVKFDANQGYATSSDHAAFLRWLARGNGDSDAIPLQDFVMRADMRCGSTIGPITASGIGIRTVDIGVATFAMHSIRELAGVEDIELLRELLQRFYEAEL